MRWIEASESPWGVRVLDVHPVTLGMLSTSRDPQAATNAMSFGSEDGTCFIRKDVALVSPTITEVGLTYKTDGVLADGALFVPKVMEEKWALFYHKTKIIFVCSWTRQVQVIASVEQLEECIKITEIKGNFGIKDESPELTIRMVDFLLKSHALGIDYPAPLTEKLSSNPEQAAMFCMSLFGKRALFATPDTVPAEKSKEASDTKPIRTHSLLHIAVARGDHQAVEQFLGNGMSADLLAGDGLSLLHWAVASKYPILMVELLLKHKANVDIPSFGEQATPLMNATQRKKIDVMRLLLDKGANANAADKRGFTSLHGACKMGNVEAVKLLLERNAMVTVEAEGGHTPLSPLAEMRKEQSVIDLLETRFTP